MTPSGFESDIQRSQDLASRVQAVYSRRDQHLPVGRYSRFVPRELCGQHEREHTLISLLWRLGVTDLSTMRILDVGCGRGATLRLFLEYGAKPANLFGVDLLSDRVDQARELNSKINFQQANATAMSFGDQVFDLVVQFTTFTSIPDLEARIQVANEILRVLVPGGKLLWYDMAYNNPNNADVKGISPSEVRKLFPGCRIFGKRITLAPLLGRVIARFSYPLYHLLAQIPFLCTHYACIIEKSQT